MLTATAVCLQRHRSQNLAVLLALKIQISFVILPFTMFTRSRLPIIMDQCSRWVSKEKVDRFRWGQNSRPTVHPTEGETPFIWKKREPMAYSKLWTHGLPQTPVLKRMVKTAGTIREQPG